MIQPITRKATDDDFDRVFEMAEKFYRSAHLNDIAPFNKEHVAGLIVGCMNDKDKALFVAEDGDSLAGMVLLALVPFTLSPAAKFAYEIAWWTEPNERQKGVGKLLFGAIESWAENVGATHIQMAALASSGHDSVTAIYLKNGFHLLESAYLRRV